MGTFAGVCALAPVVEICERQDDRPKWIGKNAYRSIGYAFRSRSATIHSMLQELHDRRTEMTRLNGAWAALFVFLVACALFLATTGSFAINDPQ
jgi:hypothetical protein